MLTFFDRLSAVGCRRREFLKMGGGLAAAGLVLPEWAAGAPAKPFAAGSAKSCILVYLLGGPPHQDMFDLKPEAPAEIRGPFRPIATNVPGLEICELLPQLAQRAERYALVRSVSHRNSNHTPMIYYTLTGFHNERPDQDNDLRPPQRTDFPHMGAVLSKFGPTAGGMTPAGPTAALPGYVAVPEVATRSSISGAFKRARTPLRGGGSGFLGAQYAPLAVNGEPGTRDAIPAVALPSDVSIDRFDDRSTLLSLLDRGVPRVTSTEELATLRRRAVVLTGAANRGTLDTFSLDAEPAELRERYGKHRFGQSLLLARRLAEAGVPMIAVNFNEMTICDGWDLHSGNFDALKTELLPMLDQGLSALMDDLAGRGLLDETLVVCMGEFGRTPKINPSAGRDHWGECSSTLLFGGGIRGGQVYGSSDRLAAYPHERAVDPADIQATIYRCLGLPAGQTMYDLNGRAWPVTNGTPIEALV